MRFEQLDLNLLVVLDALLEEQSVSRAAERLNLSQSGASAALSRLREFFEDDLLKPTGRSMSITPRGEALIQPVRSALELIRGTILTTQAFDPAQSDRTIAIAAIDVVVQVLLTKAVGLFAREAPGMTFEILPISEEPATMLQRGQADIVIALDYLVSTDQPSEKLYDEDFVIIGWRDNPLLAGPMTKELYQQLGHVSVRLSRNVVSFDEIALRRLGIERKIEALAPSFVSLARFVIETNRIAMIHRRLASQLNSTLPIKIFELPFEFPKVREVAHWSSRSANDDAIKWVLTRLKEIAATL